MSTAARGTWAVLRGGPLNLDDAAALARARRSPRWGWIPVDAAAEPDGAGDVRWLAGSLGVEPPPGTTFHARIAALPAGDHLVFAHAIAGDLRVALSTHSGRGTEALTIEPATAIVGPDGAPLWRAGSMRVADLRDQGYEPDAARAFLAPEAAPRAVYFELKRLRLVNRDTIRALHPDERQRRLAHVLDALGVRGDRDYLDLLWTGVRPRLSTFDDARSLLSYLSSDWVPPGVEEREASELVRLRDALHGAPPRSGEAAVEILDGLGGGPDGIPRRRRLVRWVLTGQKMAPALHAVWDHMGSDRALSRISEASARVST
jgi:hypothetical protein